MLLYFTKKIRKKKRFFWRPSISQTYKRLTLVCFFGVFFLMFYTGKAQNKLRKNLSPKEQKRSTLTTKGEQVSTTDSVKEYQIISSSSNFKVSSDTDLGKVKKRNKHNCSENFWNSHLMSLAFDSGRTGNQLFRFASLLAISKTVCFKAVRTPVYLRYLDPIFDLQNVEILRENYTFEFIGEQGYATYDPVIFSKISPKFNWTLGGFRQSFRYFQNQSDFVRSSFQFKDNILQDVNQFLSAEWFQEKPKVCIHIRRKDMAKKRTIKDGRVSARIEFINSSITYMKNYLSPFNFSLIVVSDDKPWCIENIKGDNVYISPFPDAGRDLYLLTQCDHNIVTSGTYSWWGAWLNETGLTIYNKLYPIPNSNYSRGFEQKDYYPSHWIGM